MYDIEVGANNPYWKGSENETKKSHERKTECENEAIYFNR